MASIVSSLFGQTKLYAYYYMYLLTALIILVILAGVICYHCHIRMTSIAKLYEPSPRFLHGAAPVRGKCYLWGGRVQGFSWHGRRKLASTIEIFDPYLETWKKRHITGVPPPGLYGGACTSLLDSLYWFGGFDDNTCYNSLHRLDPTTLEWRELQPLNQADGPMRKAGCGMVPFLPDRLAVFGGYGIRASPRAMFTLDTQNYTDWWQWSNDTNYTDGSGWSKELHVFDITKSMWVLHYLHDERYAVDFSVIKYAGKMCYFTILQASGPPLPPLALDLHPVAASPSLPLTITRQCSLEGDNQDMVESMTATSWILNQWYIGSLVPRPRPAFRRLQYVGESLGTRLGHWYIQKLWSCKSRMHI